MGIYIIDADDCRLRYEGEDGRTRTTPVHVVTQGDWLDQGDHAVGYEDDVPLVLPDGDHGPYYLLRGRDGRGRDRVLRTVEDARQALDRAGVPND